MSSAAISPLERPRATRASTSVSRSVRPASCAQQAFSGPPCPADAGSRRENLSSRRRVTLGSLFAQASAGIDVIVQHAAPGGAATGARTGSLPPIPHPIPPPPLPPRIPPPATPPL